MPKLAPFVPSLRSPRNLLANKLSLSLSLSISLSRALSIWGTAGLRRLTTVVEGSNVKSCVASKVALACPHTKKPDLRQFPSAPVSLRLFISTW